MGARDEPGLAGLPQKDFVVITPYLVDPAGTKRVNVGDGFILDSALKLIGARPVKAISSRLPISEDDLALINSSKLVLVAGANTLKTDFQIAPNFTPQLLDRIAVPVALCGIGHFGIEAATARPLDAPSQAIVREILRRIPFASVRCDASAAYLSASVPDLAEQVLMTSCPVVFPVDGLDGGFARKDRYDQLVVTITDRDALPPQLRLLELAAQTFQAERKVLALHQDYNHTSLWDFARGLGYEVFTAPDYGAFLDLYRRTDLHVGNRLHAHLKCLSYGARSFLTPFDLRQAFFAQSLDFPLIKSIPFAEFDDYDFARVGARLRPAAARMARFTEAVNAVLDR